MRAVNLIDVAERRGGGGRAGRSGGAAHLLLGLLAVLVVLVGAYALADRSVSTKTDQLAVAQRDAAHAEARVAELQAFTRFADLKARRVQTVQSIAATRYDWAHTMHELARVIPDKVGLTALHATVAPGVGGGTGAGNSLRGALSVPALEMQGCAVGHPRVSQLMTRLRLMDGVTRVSLQSSVKSGGGKSSGAVASPGSAAGGCSGAQDTSFNLVAFLDPVTTKTDPTAPTAGAAAQPVAATTTGAPK